MKKPASPRSGDPFEILVKEELKEALAAGRLGITPTSARVFRGKGYYSRDRQASIKTDLSIEVTRPDQQDPWLIWIWECKDYSGAVGVEDLEEFHAKLEQIGADKTKGTVVTSSCFQKGAVEFARAKGIGLVRRTPDGSTIYLVEAVRGLTDEHLIRGLTDADTRCIESHFYGLTTTGSGFKRLDEYLAEELRN